MLNLEAWINILSLQCIRNARCKLAGGISFPVVLVLTSQMSDHDLINHALGILLILNGSSRVCAEPETKPFFHSPLTLHTPLCSHIIALGAFTSNMSFMCHAPLICIPASLTLHPLNLLNKTNQSEQHVPGRLFSAKHKTSEANASSSCGLTNINIISASMKAKSVHSWWKAQSCFLSSGMCCPTLVKHPVVESNWVHLLKFCAL